MKEVVVQFQLSSKVCDEKGLRCFPFSVLFDNIKFWSATQSNTVLTFWNTHTFTHTHSNTICVMVSRCCVSIQKIFPHSGRAHQWTSWICCLKWSHLHLISDCVELQVGSCGQGRQRTKKTALSSSGLSTDFGTKRRPGALFNSRTSLQLFWLTPSQDVLF